jgi:hypothetical protein
MLDGLAVQLGEAVGGLRQQVRSGMFAAVPFGVLFRVAETEVGADIDDGNA